jgi:hypothetical protein
MPGGRGHARSEAGVIRITGAGNEPVTVMADHAGPDQNRRPLDGQIDAAWGGGVEFRPRR